MNSFINSTSYRSTGIFADNDRLRFFAFLNFSFALLDNCKPARYNECLTECKGGKRMKPTELFYNAPATDWNEANPIGNGRLGAMLFGRTDRERIQLNEESIWSGTERDRCNPDAAQYRDEIQRLMLSGAVREAEELTVKAYTGTPPEGAIYQTAGDLFLDFEPPAARDSDYRRVLNLADAVWRVEGDRRRTAFASAADDVIVYRIESRETFSLSAHLERRYFCSGTEHPSSDTLLFHGGDDIRFTVAVRALAE
jgi:alpha-L-fucosidase 2